MGTSASPAAEQGNPLRVVEHGRESLQLLRRGNDFGRRYREAANAQAQFDEYVRTTAGSGGAAAEIDKAKQLLDSGAITKDEFDAIKAKALA